MTAPPGLGIPWYVHPAADPGAWAALAALVPRPRFVVVNVEDGPGGADDPYYPAALAGLGRLELAGYVDLAYGDRPIAEVLADVRAWRERYGVTGVFLDQVPTEPRRLTALARLVAGARRAGCGLVLGNPGVVPPSDQLEVFDVTCVFEGDRSAHVEHRPPPWLLAVPPDRVWHLVHGCAPRDVPLALLRAGRLGAGVAWATDGRLPNPWSGLPALAVPRRGPATPPRQLGR